MDCLEELRRLTEAVRRSGADIAPTYAEYIQLAFAIATDCGEAGREYFHQLCELCPKYQREHAERMFSEALKSGRGDMHLGTAFHLAKLAGACIKERTDYREQITDVSCEEKNAMQCNAGTPHTCTREGMPNFPEAEWPEPLNSIASYGATPAQRDILLLGALTVLGASMERHVRCLYGGKMQYPCMQTFVVAPPASGKGMLSFLRLLVEPIHYELRHKVEQELEAYRKEKAAYDILGKERVNKEAPKKPANKMFIISGNNTGTGILQNIMDADGTGLIFETEADTISTAIGAEYGHWSDTLRKAFDHDPLSYNRRTNEEYREVRKSFLSILLSGTPGQVKPLIPSSENGLFSRQLFYFMPTIREWRDQFDCHDKDLERDFREMGREWKAYIDNMKLKGLITLKLSSGQMRDFNGRFARIFEQSAILNGDEMSSSVVRLAINICRILSIVAVLRGNTQPAADVPADNVKDGIVQNWDAYISDADFNAVMGMVEVLHAHATHILSFLPQTEVAVRSNVIRNDFFVALPEEFTRTHVKELAQSMNINVNTAMSWLERMKKQGAIAETGVRGEYRRGKSC